MNSRERAESWYSQVAVENKTIDALERQFEAAQREALERVKVLEAEVVRLEGSLAAWKESCGAGTPEEMESMMLISIERSKTLARALEFVEMYINHIPTYYDRNAVRRRIREALSGSAAAKLEGEGNVKA